MDLNNNNNSSIAPAVTPVSMDNSISLDRVAILKAFAASQRSNVSASDDQITTATSVTSRVSRFEKPSSYREARRLKHQHRQQQKQHPTLSDPAIEHEFVRLRDSVPSIAGSNVSDLTIINEAISLICDLESQLIRKLKCQNLSALQQLAATSN